MIFRIYNRKIFTYRGSKETTCSTERKDRHQELLHRDLARNTQRWKIFQMEARNWLTSFGTLGTPNQKTSWILSNGWVIDLSSTVATVDIWCLSIIELDCHHEYSRTKDENNIHSEITQIMFFRISHQEPREICFWKGVIHKLRHAKYRQNMPKIAEVSLVKFNWN